MFKNIINNHFILLIGIVLIIAINSLLYLFYTQGRDFREDLLNAELQRKAVLTASSFKYGLVNENFNPEDESVSEQIKSLSSTFEEITYASIGVFDGTKLNVISSSDNRKVGTTLQDKEYLTAHSEQKVLSYKVTLSQNDKAISRAITVIVPMNTEKVFENENYFLILEISLNDIDYLSNILRSNNINLTIFIAAISTLILILTTVLTDIYFNKSKTLSLEVISKDQLLASAAHELGNPTSFIRGALTKVLKTESSNITQKGKILIERSLITSTFMKTFIEDLLVVSRLERGKVQIFPRPMYIDEVITMVYNNNISNAEQKGIKLVYTKPNSEIPKVIADPDKLNEVITNFVSNAIKYSYKGEVQIKLKIFNSVLKVSVSDNGDGISEQDKKKLFKRFSRLAQTAQKEKGTGLGLYISKMLIEMHGGEIGLISEVGHGSTFYFTLPIN